MYVFMSSHPWGNSYFDQSLNIYLRYHKIFGFPGGPSTNIQGDPKKMWAEVAFYLTYLRLEDFNQQMVRILALTLDFLPEIFTKKFCF